MTYLCWRKDKEKKDLIRLKLQETVCVNDRVNQTGFKFIFSLKFPVSYMFFSLNVAARLGKFKYIHKFVNVEIDCNSALTSRYMK